MYFTYGETEMTYLIEKDKRLGEAIQTIGKIQREVNIDVFHSIVNHIVGQQISTAAQKTINHRLLQTYGKITPFIIADAPVEELQNHGISFRKVTYMKDLADKVLDGSLVLEDLKYKSDLEVITELSALKGIGKWTAQMLLIFCFERPDVLSFGDLAIHRGLPMLYHHREIDQKLFDKYKRRYSPCATVASLYLWAIASGAISGMKDYQPKKANKIG